MFESARLKLTAWYLLIISLISILFSVAFYHASTREIDRLIYRVQIRDIQNADGIFSPGIRFFSPPTVQELELVKQRLQLNLVFINGCIILLAGTAAYFLAGRTLRPIKEMVDEQNRFIADSSHELRTPLTALRSEIEVGLLDTKMTTSNAKKLLASNLEEVIHLQSLSDNLLQLAQYHKKQDIPLFKTVSLQQVVEDALKKVIPLAKQKQIVIQNTIEDAKFTGDYYSLVQLFVIILENAIKYSHEKTEVFITSEQRKHLLTIHIEDHGMGIDQQDLPHIFNRFYRADKSRTKSDVSGYGLGLSIAKKIVESHKGTITVKSRINEGTTFSLNFPIFH